MERLPELANIVRRHLGHCNEVVTGLGINLYTADQSKAVHHADYEPMLCVVLEGTKRTRLGGETYAYGVGDYLVVSADLPVSGQVVTGPYVAVGIPLVPELIAELVFDLGQAGRDASVGRGLVVSRMEAPLMDAVGRYIALLDQPADVAVMAPLIRREILWRLLCGEHAGMVRQIGIGDGNLGRVQRVIRHLRRAYAEPLRIEALARLAGMSQTSLHRHFKAVTAMTPLQFQKQIRLQEARNRLMSYGRDVAGVGYAVGYDSPSQFSREYSRQFGLPPARDMMRHEARSAVTLDTSVVG